MKFNEFIPLLLFSFIDYTDQRRGGGGRGFGGARSSSGRSSVGSRGYSSRSSGSRSSSYGSYSRGTMRSGYSSWSPGRKRFAAFAGGAAVGYIVGRSMRRRYYYNRNRIAQEENDEDYGEGVCNALIEESKLQENGTDGLTSVNDFDNQTVIDINGTIIRIYWDCEMDEKCHEEEYDCVEKKQPLWASILKWIGYGVVGSIMMCSAMFCCKNKKKHEEVGTTTIITTGPIPPPGAPMNAFTVSQVYPGAPYPPPMPNQTPAGYPLQVPEEPRLAATASPSGVRPVTQQSTTPKTVLPPINPATVPPTPSNPTSLYRHGEFSLPDVHDADGPSGRRIGTPEFEPPPDYASAVKSNDK